jgi:hypothetical protein
MRLPVLLASAHDADVKIAPEFDDREMREFWREFARLITFFDLVFAMGLRRDRNRRIS